jgi:hypothetical protein
MAALLNGRELREIVLDLDGHDRIQIALDRDMTKLLSFVNGVSVHQFKESDIISANGVVFGPIEKRDNIIQAMERDSAKYPLKVAVKLAMPYSLATPPVTFTQIYFN